MAERKSYGRTKSGLELTDEVIERLADDAEAGLDVTKLRRRPVEPAEDTGPPTS